MDVTAHIDGASRGNPGPAAAGIVIRELDAERTVHEAGYVLGHSTNNVAEYHGLIRALQLIPRIKGWDGGEVRIFSDSQLMVRQITGEYRVKSAGLAPLLDEAQMLLMRLERWQIRHVPREQNKRADELANMALDAGRDVIVVAGDGSAVSPAPGAARTGASNAAQPAFQWRAWLVKKPTKGCPANCPAKTPFTFGPSTPQGFCVFAAQAVFDENPTLWRESGKTNAQTSCPKCGVTIEVEQVDE